MGNSSNLRFLNCCFKEDLESQQLKNALSKYQRASPRSDLYFGECYLLQNQDGTSTQILLKQNVYQEELTNQLNYLSTLKKLSDGPANQNVLSTDLFATIQKTTCFRKSHDLFITHDLILTDLLKEFNHRIITDEEFTQSQIKVIIKSCTKGLIRLEFTEYSSLTMDHIYFCGQGKDIKVAHPKLFNYPSNLALVEASPNSASTKHIYLSPEQLSALQRYEYSFIGGQSSNAFTFGMIILSLMSMKHLDYLYSYQTCEVLWDQLENVIKQCNSKFPFHLISIVQDLLKLKLNSRIGFKDLYNRLQTNQTANKYSTNELVVSILGLANQDGGKDKEQIDKQRGQEFARALIALGEEGKASQAKISTYIDKQKQFKMRHPNFLAAYLKPRINMHGQYARVSQKDDTFQQYIAESIVANQRLRYTDPNETSTLGSYIGQTMVLEGTLKKEPLREGKGLYQHSDGQTYIGDWHLGKMHGFGKLYYSNKKLRYEGEFKNDMFDGNGTEYEQNQIREREEEIDQDYVKIFKGNWIKYEGHYKEDKKHGPGKIFFRKGYWRGNFRNGQPNGQGIFHSYLTEKQTKGKWDDGQLIRFK